MIFFACRRDPNLVPITDFFGSVRKVSELLTQLESEKIWLSTNFLPDWGVRQCCECFYYAGGGDNDQGGQRRGEWGGQGRGKVKATLHLRRPDAYRHPALCCLASPRVALTVKWGLCSLDLMWFRIKYTTYLSHPPTSALHWWVLCEKL